MTQEQTQEVAAKKAKATAYESVSMDDGVVVEFAGNRKLSKTMYVTDDGADAVRFDFRNGEVRHYVLTDEIKTADGQSLLVKFALHGAAQKIGDECAGLDDIDDCVMAVDELLTRLSEGSWGIVRQTSALAGTSVLARALAESTGKPMDAIKKFLATKNQGEKVALRNNPKIAPIVARLEAEKTKRTKNTVDTEALLEELA